MSKLGLQGEAGQHTEKVEKFVNEEILPAGWEGVHSRCQENMSQVGCE